MSIVTVPFDPESMSLVETNVPEMACVDFGTIIMPALAFDSSTEEYANGMLTVPATIDSSGTVTFRAYVSPKTGAASKNIGLTLGHRPIGDTEAIDGSYTDEDSGAKAITATTGNVTLIEWTETVANLAWVADDLMPIRVSRDTTVANNLSGDCYLLRFEVDIPVT